MELKENYKDNDLYRVNNELPTDVIKINERLEELRIELRNECISYGELIELEELREYIDENDIELLHAINND